MHPFMTPQGYNFAKKLGSNLSRRAFLDSRIQANENSLNLNFGSLFGNHEQKAAPIGLV